VTIEEEEQEEQDERYDRVGDERVGVVDEVEREREN
jgi:hypothetical protein